MSYLAKRLEEAVRTLVGDGPIKQRLGLAYGRHLDDLQPAEWPEPLQSTYTQLRSAMHRAAPIGKETSVTVTVRKMSFAEAAAHAEAIVALYAEVLRNADRVETLKVVHGDKSMQSDEIPRHLASRSISGASASHDASAAAGLATAIITRTGS